MAIATSTRTVSEILDRALQGQRITDEDALVLLHSRDLVSIGQAMGATDLTSFGDSSGAIGPLPGLV